MNRSLLAVVGTVVVAVAAFAVLVPDRREDTDHSQSWLSHIPEVAAAESLQTARVDSMIELRALVQRLETRAAARALPPAAEPLAFTADPRLPAEVRARFAEKVRAEFATLQSSAEGDALRGRVRVHLAGVTGTVRGNYLRYVVLPDAPDAPCTVMLEAPVSTNRLAPRGREYLLGTCGFYARFGAAGPGMRAWLEETRGEAAAGDVAPAPDSTYRSRTGRRHRISALDMIYAPDAAACASGNDAACTALFDVRWRGRWANRGSGLEDARARDVLRGDPYFPLSPSSVHLAAMRVELGDTRFAEVWKSAQGPADAYESLEGKSVGALVRAQMLQEIEPHRPGPLAARLPMLFGLAVAGLCAGVAVSAARRRRS